MVLIVVTITQPNASHVKFCLMVFNMNLSIYVYLLSDILVSQTCKLHQLNPCSGRTDLILSVEERSFASVI